MKFAVKKLDPAIVKSIRRIIDNPTKAEHPVYDVSRSLGTGKATCRACEQPIRENERSILFWHAPHDKDHEHHYRRTRMVIHEDDCATAKGNVKCPVCKKMIPENGWKKHWQNHEIATGWKLGSTFVCAKHLEAHCGQCEEDRIIEEPELDSRVVKIPTKHKKKKASEWRHENNDGFEMWETKENPNRFAIIENDNKYDLYALQGTFDSPEQAKSAAEGMKKTAQDGGGGGGGGGGASGGGGSGGGDGGSSSGDGGGAAGASSDGGGESSGDSGFSSSSENSESNSSSSGVEENNGDEDPRPPSDNPHENPEKCPTCDERLNPIYVGSGIFYSCWKCGFTSRNKKKKRTEAAWIDRLDRAHRAEPEEEKIEILDISPKVAPVMLDEPDMPPSESKSANDLF